MERERDERRQVRDSHKVPNWQDYLEAEAAKRDEEASRALNASSAIMILADFTGSVTANSIAGWSRASIGR